MPNPIVHFEIPADDVARAKAFYEKVFGWKVKRFPLPPGGPEYYGVHAKARRAGHRRRAHEAQHARSAVRELRQRQVDRRLLAKGAGERRPDHHAEAEIAPGMGWIAVFRDPEGNMMGLHQAPASMPPKKSPQRRLRKKK